MTVVLFYRDGLTKSLYTSLFEWLVSKINSTTVKDTKLNYIAVLDIYGFEVNSHRDFGKVCNFVAVAMDVVWLLRYLYITTDRCKFLK